MTAATGPMVGTPRNATSTNAAQDGGVVIPDTGLLEAHQAGHVSRHRAEQEAGNTMITDIAIPTPIAMM
jgi:hypothetical protein